MATKHEVIATRRTADGVRVDVWSDGAITVGHEISNRIVARGLPRDVALVIADDVCLFDAAEVKALVKAARKANTHRRQWDWIAGWRDNCELRRLMRVFMEAA